MQTRALVFAAAGVALGSLLGVGASLAAAQGQVLQQAVPANAAQQIRIMLGVPRAAVQAQVAQRRVRRVRPAPRGDVSGSIVLQEDSQQRRNLEAIRRTLEQGHAAEAARHLGTLLQDPATRDFFIAPSDEDRSRRSFKFELQRMISTLPPEGMEAYELQFGAAARKLLDTAIAQGDGRALEEVATRYYHTAASAQALFVLGKLHLDRGQAREAASCLERLQGMPALAAPFQPQLGLMIASCWMRAGEPAQARRTLTQLKEQFPEARFATAASATPQRLFDDPEQSLHWLEQLMPAIAGTHRREMDWPVYLGSPSRLATVPASQPFAAARWSLPISSDADILHAIENEARQLRAQKACPIPMIHPVAIGDLLLISTNDGVQAIDTHTGQPRWPVDEVGQFTNSGVARRIWRDAAFGALATDGRSIYLVSGNSELPDDSQGSQQPQAVFWRGPWGGGEEIAEETPTNQLAALSIAGQGKLLWTASGDSPDHPELAGATFLGNPLPYGGQLFVLAEVRGAIRLYCLDASSGAVQWWQELAVVEHAITSDIFRRMIGASPSISDGVVVCPTSAGGVVAVDLTTRSLLWAYQYPRQPGTLHVLDQGRIATLRQGERWLDSAAVIAGGLVLLTPPESDEIHCLDLFTGELRWSQKRQQSLYLAAVHGDHVVLVEPQQVTALHLETGEPVWKRWLPAKVTGRGVLTGDGRYHLPLSNASIQQVNLADGQLGTPMLSLRGLAPGNLLWHQGVFISVSPAYIEAFDDYRHLQTELARRAAQSPHDAAVNFDQGRIALVNGKLPEAIAHFEAAYRARPSDHYKAAYLAAMQDGLRAKLPGSERWQAELDRLLGF